MSRRKIGPCRLCDAEEMLTREDVFPTWLRKEYAKNNILAANLPPRTTLDVCMACNQRMAASFEDVAAPILKKLIWTNAAGGLTADEAHTIVRWSIKTDALFALTRSKPGQVVLTHEGADGMRQTVAAMMDDPGLVPNGSMVRMAVIDTHAARARQGFNPVGIHPTLGGMRSLHQIGLIVTDTVIAGDPDEIRRFARRTAGDARMSMLAPTRMQWPPPRPIAPTDITLMRAEQGHQGSNILNSGWTLRIST